MCLGDLPCLQRAGQQGVEGRAGERRQGQAAQAVTFDAGHVRGTLVFGGERGEQSDFKRPPASGREDCIADSLEIQAGDDGLQRRRIEVAVQRVGLKVNASGLLLGGHFKRRSRVVVSQGGEHGQALRAALSARGWKMSSTTPPAMV